MTKTDRTAAVEAETRAIGREMWDHLERRQPSIFEGRWWEDRLLSWAMQDESVKVQMFRFVDVLPTSSGLMLMLALTQVLTASSELAVRFNPTGSV